MTTPQILAIQLTAVRTGNRALLLAAWRALGHHMDEWFRPVTPREQQEAIEMLQAVWQ